MNVIAVSQSSEFNIANEFDLILKHLKHFNSQRSIPSLLSVDQLVFLSLHLERQTETISQVNNLPNQSLPRDMRKELLRLEIENRMYCFLFLKMMYSFVSIQFRWSYFVLFCFFVFWNKNTTKILKNLSILLSVTQYHNVSSELANLASERQILAIGSHIMAQNNREKWFSQN